MAVSEPGARISPLSGLIVHIRCALEAEWSSFKSSHDALVNRSCAGMAREADPLVTCHLQQDCDMLGHLVSKAFAEVWKHYLGRASEGIDWRTRTELHPVLRLNCLTSLVRRQSYTQLESNLLRCCTGSELFKAADVECTAQAAWGCDRLKKAMRLASLVVMHETNQWACQDEDYPSSTGPGNASDIRYVVWMNGVKDPHWHQQQLSSLLAAPVSHAPVHYSACTSHEPSSKELSNMPVADET